MARVHGKDIATLTLATQTLLADTIALNFKASAQTHDTTTIGDDWIEHTAGLKGGDEITHEMFYDNTETTGTWDYVSGLLGGAASELIISDGTRTITVDVIVKDVTMPISVADMMKFTATYQLTGEVAFT